MVAGICVQNVAATSTQIGNQKFVSYRYTLFQAEAEVLALEARAQAFIALGHDADAKAPKVDPPRKSNNNSLFHRICPIQ